MYSIYTTNDIVARENKLTNWIHTNFQKFHWVWGEWLKRMNQQKAKEEGIKYEKDDIIWEN